MNSWCQLHLSVQQTKFSCVLMFKFLKIFTRFLKNLCFISEPVCSGYSLVKFIAFNFFFACFYDGQWVYAFILIWLILPLHLDQLLVLSQTLWTASAAKMKTKYFFYVTISWWSVTEELRSHVSPQNSGELDWGTEQRIFQCSLVHKYSKEMGLLYFQIMSEMKTWGAQYFEKYR